MHNWHKEYLPYFCGTHSLPILLHLAFTPSAFAFGLHYILLEYP